MNDICIANFSIQFVHRINLTVNEIEYFKNQICLCSPYFLTKVDFFQFCYSKIVQILGYNRSLLSFINIGFKPVPVEKGRMGDRQTWVEKYKSAFYVRTIKKASEYIIN